MDRGKRPRQNENSAYDSKQIQGMKVSHSIDDFNEGEEIILTLKDQSVLGDKSLLQLDDDYDADMDIDGEDELENIYLSEKDKQAKVDQKKAKSKKPKYDIYGENTSLLGQYDEEEEENNGFRIGDKSTKSSVSLSESIRAKLTANLVDLGESVGPTIASNDYYTEEEALSFKKKKKKTEKTSGEEVKVKNKVSLTELLLNSNANRNNDDNDHGSRDNKDNLNASTLTAKLNEQKQSLKDASYLLALKKANEDTKKLYSVHSSVDNDSYEDIEKNLMKDRLAMLRAKSSNSNSVVSSNSQSTTTLNTSVANTHETTQPSRLSIAEIIAKKKADELAKKHSHFVNVNDTISTMTDDHSQDGKHAGEEGVVFSALSSFVSRIGSTGDGNVKEEDMFGDDSNNSNININSGGVSVKIEAVDNNIQINDSMNTVAVKQEMTDDNTTTTTTTTTNEDNEDISGKLYDTDDDDNNNEEEADDLESQAATSVSAMIALARQRGMLNKDKFINTDGRSRDFNVKASDLDSIGDRVQIMYKDESGHELTTKEAFRQLSYKFHGIAPSLTKQNKVLKRREEQARRLLGQNNLDKYDDAVEDIKVASKQAYIDVGETKSRDGYSASNAMPSRQEMMMMKKLQQLEKMKGNNQQKK